jgi:tetratricopeptide (TPR) repeat protein
VTDLPFRKILGLNQQTYQRLKIALSLNLRRQVFMAVCDDLVLRDRLAAQLVDELTPSKPQAEQGQSEPKSVQRHPRLVSLHLHLDDPNPIAQAAQWLAQAPQKRGNRPAPIPAFQILGIEQLTRQPASTQRLFLTYLQDLERSLPTLESSLLFWLPKPWFHALPQSAPEFWRCRTAVFEFVGDPTPLPPLESDSPIHPQQRSVTLDLSQSPATSGSADASRQDFPPENSSPSQADLWSILARDLAKLERHDDEGSHPENGETRYRNGAATRVSAKSTQTVTASPQVAVKAKLASQPAIATSVSSATQPVVKAGVATQTNSAIAPHQAAHTKSALPLQPGKPLEQALTDKQANEQAEHQTAVALKLPLASETDPTKLLQQIEKLHQQQAPALALVEAYRTLGNIYRDRVEQGEVSLINLKSAIQAYEQVLVWLHETSSIWADVLNDLGNLYWMLSRYSFEPEQALAHLQQGIQAYQLALTKLNLQTQPQAYPMVQNNLGAAYADLARYQDPADNLQRSVQAYQQALRYRKAEDDPQRYASTQNNLGTTYWNLAQHQQPMLYLKQAIAAYSEALQYYHPEQEPLSYAMIQNNLGTAYWNLAQHERPQDWLRLALGAYKVALKYRTLDAAPVAFAATQNNLGTAYWHLANHAKDEPEARLDYLRQAIHAYETTLSAADRLAEGTQAAPLNFDLFATHNNLGLAHHQIATDPQSNLDTTAKSTHLEVALHHHLQALQGWQNKPDFRQTALSCVTQTIRSLYSHCGLAGQNLALSRVPGHLLPEILPKL